MAKHKKEKNSIKEFFDLEEKLFDSRLYYPGEWIIGDEFNNSVLSNYDDISSSTLYLNSLKNGNDNAFAKFLERRFKPLVEYAYGAGYKDLANEVYPYIAMQENDNQRYLSFGKASILSGLIVKCFPITLEEKFRNIENKQDLTDDSALEILRECLKADRNIIRDVRDNPASPYRDIVNVVTPEGLPVSPQRRKEKLDEIISSITTKIRATKYMDKLLGAKIDYKEFMECFDYDKLCLIIALSAYLDTRKHLEEEGLCPGSMMYLHDYVLTVEHLRKNNVRYNENIKICVKDKNGRLKETTIDTNTIIRYFEEIVKEHPEIKEQEIDLDELFKKFNVTEEYTKSLDPVEYTNLLQDLVDRNKKLEAITLNWEILPVKEGLKENEGQLPRRKYTPGVDTFDVEGRSNIFNSYIASLSPVLELKGINNFDGYIAYVFNNSKVILEKPKGIKKSEYYGATYVMDLNNFFELSKLSRTEIIEGLQSGDITGVTRVYHTFDEKAQDPIEKYKKRIERHLSGSEYSKDKIDSIYAIIESERSKKDEKGYQRTRTDEN